MNVRVNMPGTLVEAIRVSSDLDYSTALFANARWPNGVCCPHCESTNVVADPEPPDVGVP